jgi:hypothetical protein
MTACSTTQYNIANAQTPRFNMPLFLHLHCSIEVGHCLQVSVHSREDRYVHCLSFGRHPSAARIHCSPHIGERANIALPDLVKCYLFSTQNLLYTLSILASWPQSSIHLHVKHWHGLISSYTRLSDGSTCSAPSHTDHAWKRFKLSKTPCPPLLQPLQPQQVRHKTID